MNDATRLSIRVTGVVQGVGFRPFVYGLAARWLLGGAVWNEASDVVIEIEGAPRDVEAFLIAIEGEAPPLSRVESVTARALAPTGGRGFHIEASRGAVGRDVAFSPDVATCDDCLREIRDPADRRYRYAFTNCTNCGPRLTIITGAPYDRERTTMASFTMCARCRAEYDDPRDRRFHAQPIACPACGPRLTLRDRVGAGIACDDPIAETARRLLRGEIAAIKGLGGYHLACAASSEAAVAELRRRKHRDEKPFAIMLADVAAATRLCVATPADLAMLASRERPITLMERRDGGALAIGVAPGLSLVGVMLPYTPLHHLLLEAVGGAPLVMTSGNRSDEPIVFRDEDALARLADIADFFLVHDRPIHVRCDDSVVRDGVPVRRSRGFAPGSIRLRTPLDRPTLAVGGQLKNAFALGCGDRATLSGHAGDLDERSAYEAYVAGIAHYERLLEITPELVVHDLHPDYASTRYAIERGISRLGVQHHHAHMAACMADNELTGRTIGVTFDGMGYAADGALWGGEWLVGDARAFTRAAHLREVALPGGDRAAREGWRMAVSYLHAAGARASMRGFDPAKVRVVEQMIESAVNSPPTSSAGRLFDAVAALAGVADHSSYEGQAAMRLEALAAAALRRGFSCEPYPFAIDEDGVVDCCPLALAVLEDAAPAEDVAARFHVSLARIVADVCVRLRDGHATSQVVLTGGVFVNAVLVQLAGAALRERGFRVATHRRVPANDGGLALGQLAVAAAQASD